MKIVAFDCLREEELCEEFSVYDVPQLVIYTEDLKDDGERYRGEMKWNLIANQGAKKMQNFVSVVSEKNFEQFMARDPTKSKVILLTDKKATPTLMKAMSKKFLGKLVFGELKHTEQNLVKRFATEEEV